MLCVTVLLLLLLLATQQGYSQTQLPIRLVNGPSKHMGRVEVFVQGEWGTVCDDAFGLLDANVICKMLGYPRALTSRNRAFYGRGSGKIWVDQLNCNGNEDSIFDCNMNELGDHDCDHKEDAGVECYREIPKRPATMPVKLTCPYDMECNSQATKLGPDPGECVPTMHVEGVVEVYYNDSWQLISAEGWDDADINVVCGELGYPLGLGKPGYKAMLQDKAKIGRRRKKSFKEKISKVIMKEVECTGTETQLRLCHHYGWGPFDNPNGKVATARCGFKAHPSCNIQAADAEKPPVYRLRSGVLPWQGRVEVLYNSIWGTVCDIGFNYNSGNVLCRSLGYGTCRTITARAHYGRGIGKVWMSEVRCNGTEHWLHECKRLDWGNAPRCSAHAGDVGVECYVPDLYEGQKEVMRFIPVADSRNPGLINNFIELAGTKPGLICYDDVDTKALEALCRSHSPPQYLLAHRHGTHTLYTGQRYKGTFICNGDELDIRECRLSFTPVNKCDTGDLIVFCDRGRPDLVPVLDKFRQSLLSYPYTDLIPMYYLRCALEDECLASDAANKSNNHLRHLLRFDSLTMNYGVREFSPFLDRSQWIWHQCHNHYHSFEVFVAYDLLDSQSREKVAEGHKASFCLEDSICDPGGYAQRRCGSGIQGISVNCGDLYGRHLDCQWIDITDVKDGFYIIRVHVNPDRLVIESDYRNNIIECSIRLIGRRITVVQCSQSDH